MTEIQAQGILDVYRALDAETIEKVTSIIKAVDPEKIKKIFDMLEINEDGWVHLKIDLSFKKG